MRNPTRWSCAAALVAAACSGEPDPGVDASAPPADRAAADVPAADTSPADDAALDVAPSQDVTDDVAADGGDPPPPPLTVTRDQWNASGMNVGMVQAVAEDADFVAVYTDMGLRVLVAGAIAARDDSVRSWRTAITAAAADGSMGTWVLGVSNTSAVLRIRDRMVLDDVTGRLALGMRDIRSAARVSADAVAFGGVGSFAVLRGSAVTVWNDPDFQDLTGGGNRVAAAVSTGVKVFDLTTERAVRYSIPGVTGFALNPTGQLLVAVGPLLYVQNERGELAPQYTHPDPLRAITVSGENTWLVAGDRLGVWDGFRVRATADVTVAPGARLIPARGGGVWVLAAGALSRYSLVVDPEEQRWNTAVRSIFATRCTPCHLPGGTAGIDLSTRCAWAIRRDQIRTQVVDRMLMPPAPMEMPSMERAAIAAYLSSLSPDACGGVRDAGAPMDVPRDVTATDARADVGADVRLDAGAADVPRDAVTADVPRDVAMDVLRDAGASDVPRDVAMDVLRDAGPADVPRDTGPADVPRDVPRDTGPADSGVVSYAQVQAIFDRDCVRCHGGSGALNLAASVSYGNLVNVAAAGGSCVASGMDRVVPGDPAMSLLYRKVVGTQSCGTAMPRGAAAMSMADTEIIRRWIAAGAPR